MLNKLIKGALLVSVGAAAGVIGAMWLMSDSGKETRENLSDLASQAKEKIHQCCEKVKEEMEKAANEAEAEPAPEV